MGSPNRTLGAMAGLALGDAFARSLRGVDHPESAPIVLEAFIDWGEPTEQAITRA